MGSGRVGFEPTQPLAKASDLNGVHDPHRKTQLPIKCIQYNPAIARKVAISAADFYTKAKSMAR